MSEATTSSTNTHEQALIPPSSKNDKKYPVVICQEDLDMAFPFPIWFLLGWATLALAYLLKRDGSFQPASAACIIPALNCLALGVIASVPMGYAVRNRLGG